MRTASWTCSVRRKKWAEQSGFDQRQRQTTRPMTTGICGARKSSCCLIVGQNCRLKLLRLQGKNSEIIVGGRSCAELSWVEGQQSLAAEHVAAWRPWFFTFTSTVQQWSYGSVQGQIQRTASLVQYLYYIRKIISLYVQVVPCRSCVTNFSFDWRRRLSLSVGEPPCVLIRNTVNSWPHLHGSNDAFSGL